MGVCLHDRGWLSSSGEALCGAPEKARSVANTPDCVSRAGRVGSRGESGGRSLRVRKA